jgi:copper chaperone CopZ
MNHYIHDIPGRIRVTSPKIKNNQRAADEVKRLVTLFHGVNSVECNLVTGSILVNYHPDKLNKKDIVDLLSEKGFFDKTKAVTNDEYFRRTANYISRSVIPDILLALI